MRARLTAAEMAVLAEVTARKTAEVGVRHAQANLPFIARSVGDLPPLDPDKRRSAIVLSAGPSLHRQHTIQRILASGYSGTIVAADGALGACLRQGLIPDYVVSVDPHPYWIVRWFGDPDFDQRPDDDYFRRQDLDPALNLRERDRNQELLALVNQYGSRITGLFATGISPTVVQRCRQAGMPLYWWNPICDDPDQPDSVTRALHALTKMPCVVTGGNCGASAWILTRAILGIADTAVTGMDLSYAPGTPLTKTQYYHELIQCYPEDQLEQAYLQVDNPYLGERWYTDPTYYWYRQCFLDVLAGAEWTVANCTEGGILFGPGVRWVSLDTFINDPVSTCQS